MKFFKKKNRMELDPDEIFLDSSNLPKYNKKEFEGRLEKPISSLTIFLVGFFSFLIIAVFTGRAYYLQIIKGDEYTKKAENNRLDYLPIFAGRGIIKDRNGVALVKNDLAISTSTTTTEVPRRIYIEDEGFSHLLGFVSYPKKDKTGIFWQENYIGREGVEKQYDTLLSGTPGKKLIETNALQKITSENTIESGSDGQNITLSIDSRVQKELFFQIKTLSEKAGFVGGAGVLMDVRTGEILALSSYPEYSSNLITNNPRDEKVSAYFTRKDTPMINRVFGGLYTPGSTVKPFMALSALEENIITPSVSILSTGSISLPNKYGGPATIFRDWKVHGYVNMKEALAASSDVYFYAISGGYGTQKGLGIDIIDNYMKLYGFASSTGIDLPGEKTGIIPTPGWKIKNFPAKDSVWNIGDTYHTSIGQFGFQLTLLELVRAVAALANGGTLLTPHVLLDPQKESLQKIKIPISPENIKIINEGMRLCVTSDARGTCKTLRIPGIEVAGKSGTAQLGFKNEWVNSWMTGFFPYENPKYAFVVLMEKGPAENTYGAGIIMGKVLEWMKTNTPEYIQ